MATELLDGTAAKPAPARKLQGVWSSNPAVVLWGTMVGKKVLFTSAKVTHLNTLPQGQPERDERTLNMTAAMARELFGSCTNHGECEAVCPKQIPLEFIAQLNRDLIRTGFRRRREPLAVVGVPRHPALEDM